MKIVVNSNRIIASLIKDSTSRRILRNKKHEFLGIHFSQKEVKKHEKTILKKAKITKENYQKMFNLLFSKIRLYDEGCMEEEFVKKAHGIMKKIDEKDTAFLALALQEKCPIWSDDKHFKQQNKVKVLTTKELEKLL